MDTSSPDKGRRDPQNDTDTDFRLLSFPTGRWERKPEAPLTVFPIRDWERDDDKDTACVMSFRSRRSLAGEESITLRQRENPILR